MGWQEGVQGAAFGARFLFCEMAQRLPPNDVIQGVSYQEKESLQCLMLLNFIPTRQGPKTNMCFFRFQKMPGGSVVCVETCPFLRFRRFVSFHAVRISPNPALFISRN